MEVLMKLFIVVLIFLGVTFTVESAHYKTVCEKAEINRTLGIGKYETLIQVGNNVLDRFTMHRVVKLDKHNKPLKPSKLKGAVILLPGGGSNFDIYQLGPSGESLDEYLALRNIDVYGYSPRTRGLELGFCDSHDCSAMKNWGIETYLSDIDFIRKEATDLHHKRPVVGGLSLGAILSIASVNAKPHGYAGIFIWEGTLIYDTPVKELFNDPCAGFKALWESGQYFDNTTYPLIKTMYVLYRDDPNGPSPFAEGMTNRDFLMFFATTPNDPPLAEAPGYTYAAGNIVEGLYYIDFDIFDGFVMQMNNYDPIAVVRDYICGFSGERTFTGRLELFKGPIFSLQAGRGFGSNAEYNLSLFGSTDITRYVQPDFGHADFGACKNYADIICKPIWEWLDEKIIPLWER
jgi:pimeloyl-ACP methyl ester carboxylesterase